MSLSSAAVKLPRSPVDFQTILGASGQFLCDFFDIEMGNIYSGVHIVEVTLNILFTVFTFDNVSLMSCLLF